MRITFLFIMLTLSSSLSAVEFDVHQSEYRPLQLAWMVQGEANSESEETKLYSIVKNDLLTSQSFITLDPLSFIADASETLQKIEYADWRIIGADMVAVCLLTRTEGGWQAEVQIHDPFRSKQLASTTLKREGNELRILAHQISDFIYHTIIGVRGHFNSHILYVKKRGDHADLIYMDQDGANLQAVGKNFTLLLSPDWAPNARHVALNTYVGNRPRLEVFDLATGKRTSFGSFKGLNSTPEYSPDGRYIAAALSYTGNTEIHIYDLKTRTWRQFTHHPGIDTTPTWSPNGEWIAFTSNRNGSPQIYRARVSGGKAERISLKANYNTSPVWAPQGDRIAFITQKNWEYALATVRIDGSGLRYLVTGRRIESPSWSPNGQMLLYSAENDGIRRVYRIPAWGGKAVPVTARNMDASDPAWSR
ncbi:MAG: Tol-Pal system beta propeller repeat protein TolB [Mariprofundaceae bacterium]